MLTDHKNKQTLISAIYNRFSPREFSSRPVSENDLNALFEAVKIAPSSYNEQPWRFIVAQKHDGQDYKALAESLNEKNKAWAAEAPVLMLSIAKKTITRTGMPNRHALHDVGLAMGNLLAQATAMGMHVRQMGGFSSAKAMELLEIPGDFEPIAMAALGYAHERYSDDTAISDLLRMRNRREVKDFVFQGHWGNPLQHNNTIKKLTRIEE